MAEETTSAPGAAAKSSSGMIVPLLVLGGAGVVGYFIYSRYMSGAGEGSAAPDKPIVKKPTGPAPDLKGPKVKKGELASTKSNVCIDSGDTRFHYAKIIMMTPDGSKGFQSPINGHFTRRLLCRGGDRWAEIAPMNVRA